MKEEKIKIPYKLFFTILLIVAVCTFLIMNYNPVSITFIFFNIKIPLTILFFILIIIGGLLASIYWKNKYNKLKLKLERTKKLLAVKEELDRNNLGDIKDDE